MGVLEELRAMKIIAHGDLYVINWGCESELKVWSNGEDEALEIFRTFHKPKNYEVFSIDKLEKDVVKICDMNRKIIFRGYNLKNKKWLYGYYLVNRGKHFIAEEGLQPPGMTWEDFEVDPDSVGQFVGVFKSHLSIGTHLDYNYLYEGDLVRTTFNNRFYFNYSIRFEPKKSAFALFLQDNPIRVVDSSMIYKLIGNEYEKRLKISNP